MSYSHISASFVKSFSDFLVQAGVTTLTGCGFRPPLNFPFKKGNINAMKENTVKKSSAKNVIFLLIAAFIWGTAFVAQSVGMDFLGPFAFGFIRFLIGGLVLLPFVLANRKKKHLAVTASRLKLFLPAALICGLCLFGGSAFQQVALQYTSVGKAGFITTLYIVLVPLIGIFMKKKTTPLLWGAVGLAVVGLYLLSIKEGFRIELGDILLLLCALCFAFHILAVDHFVNRIGALTLSCMQFFMAAVFFMIAMLISEPLPALSDIAGAWFPLIYTGVLSCGIAYTFQIVGQKDFNPTAASLLMSFESVFSVLAGMVVLGEVLSFRETIGCILMFAAVILAQLPAKKKQPA